MEASAPSLCCACAGGNGENSPIRSSLWCRRQARPGLLKGFQAVSEGGLCGAEKQNVMPLPLLSQLLANSKTCIQSKTHALSLPPHSHSGYKTKFPGCRTPPQHPTHRTESRLLPSPTCRNHRPGLCLQNSQGHILLGKPPVMAS